MDGETFEGPQGVRFGTRLTGRCNSDSKTLSTSVVTGYSNKPFVKSVGGDMGRCFSSFRLVAYFRIHAVHCASKSAYQRPKNL